MKIHIVSDHDGKNILIEAGNGILEGLSLLCGKTHLNVKLVNTSLPKKMVWKFI